MKRRVLLIEDNEDCRTALRDLLEVLGHVVEDAQGGTDGLRKADDFAPEVVVLDLGLPDVDGYELTRSLRARQDPPMLIAFTGNAGSEAKQRAREAGIDLFLVKPNGLTELLDTISGSREPLRKPAS